MTTPVQSATHECTYCAYYGSSIGGAAAGLTRSIGTAAQVEAHAYSHPTRMPSDMVTPIDRDDAAPAAQLSTWTMCAHWDDADEIVVDYWLEGEVEDRRIDTGTHAGGLFAAAGSGLTLEEAERNIRAEYEIDAPADDDESDPNNTDARTFAELAQSLPDAIDASNHLQVAIDLDAIIDRALDAMTDALTARGVDAVAITHARIAARSAYSIAFGA